MDNAQKAARPVEPIAPDGLIWAVLSRPGEAPVPATREQVAARLEGGGGVGEGWLWVHFDAVSIAAGRRIGALDWLCEAARDALTRHEQGLQLDSEDGQAYGALPGFDDTLADVEQEVSTWRFAVLPDLLITTRRRPVPALYALFRAIQQRGAPESPAELVDRALLSFADGLRRDIGLLDDDLDRAEDALLEVNPEADLGDVGGMVGRARRRSTLLRRAIAPMDRIMHDEDLVLPEWAEDSLLDRSRRQMHAALDDLLALQDRARSLQDELVARQAEETNRRLYIVSVMTTLMLPATFVTGFFGMNTGGMFLAKGDAGTIEAGFICVLFMTATWLLLKRARLV